MKEINYNVKNRYLDYSISTFDDINSKNSKEILKALRSLKNDENLKMYNYSIKDTINFKKKGKIYIKDKLGDIDYKIFKIKKELKTEIKVKKTEIFKIPIMLENKQEDTYISLKITRENNAFFKKIVISRSNVIPFEAAYIHELMHALTYRNMYVITDCLDIEFLSILLEKIYIYENLKKTETSKEEKNLWNLIKSYASSIEEKNYTDKQGYYKSNIMATYILTKYKEMTEEEKKEMFSYIIKICTGNLYIHNFFEIYGAYITNQEVKDIAIDSILKK